MRKFLSIFLCICIALSLSSCNYTTYLQKSTVLTDSTVENPGLQVHFIDVGQGDCILIESKGHYALVDAGEYDESNNAVSYMGSLGVSSLDYIIATHPHSDHCGGLPKIIRSFGCSTLLFPETDVDTNTWYSVLDAADERGVTCETPKINQVYSVGEATITILSPSSGEVFSNLNNYSLVCMVEYGNTSLLLTGDAEKLIERDLIAKGFNLSADVLKLGHHGSSTSNCEEFLDAVNPSAAVITCGKDNDYGHPHKEVTDTLTARGIPFKTTAQDGTVVISSDGENISMTTLSGSEALTTSSSETPEIIYIGNKNSKIFHNQYCESVEKTKEKNKVYFTSRDEAIDQDFTPCKGCKP